MGNICCTIVSPSHIYKGITTLMSLKEYNREVLLYLVVTEPVELELKGIVILNLDYFISRDNDAKTIAEVYADNKDAIRWSFKPVILRQLIKENLGDNVIYCDCDMCFFANPVHLFEYAAQGGIVLMPHWLPLDPNENLMHFREAFRSGLFNAGCVTANERGLAALDYWATACISGCEFDFTKGLFVDQKYLDLMVIYFPETVISRHLGYNVAAWNIEHRQAFLRTHEDLSELYEIVLIHFTSDTMLQISLGNDKLLKPHLIEYKRKLHQSLCLLIDCKFVHHQKIDDELRRD